jgi:outer membrane protein assembly factor BamE
MLKLRAVTLLSFIFFLSACGVLYKVDVNQGNLLDQKTVDTLKPGFTKRQVELLLGTPSIQTPFHQNRWDYAATFSRRGAPAEIKNLSLFFEDNQLVRIEGDYLAKPAQDLLEDASRLRGKPIDPFEESESKKPKSRGSSGG